MWGRSSVGPQYIFLLTVISYTGTFSGQHPMVERADKFENGYVGVRGWWFNVFDVSFDNPRRLWHTVNNLLHSKTSLPLPSFTSITSISPTVFTAQCSPARISASRGLRATTKLVVDYMFIDLLFVTLFFHGFSPRPASADCCVVDPSVLTRPMHNIWPNTMGMQETTMREDRVTRLVTSKVFLLINEAHVASGWVGNCRS